MVGTQLLTLNLGDPTLYGQLVGARRNELGRWNLDGACFDENDTRELLNVSFYACTEKEISK